MIKTTRKRKSNDFQINVRSLLVDTFEIFMGIGSIFRHGFHEDNIQLGISFFSTDFQEVKVGLPCIYTIDICNTAEHCIWVKLLFEVYKSDGYYISENKYSAFEKNIYLQAQISESFHVIYDWRDYLTIDVGEKSFKPDNFYKGKCESVGRYYVKASLLNKSGEAFDALSLIQYLCK